MLKPYDLQTEDPDLHEQLVHGRQQTSPAALENKIGKWRRTGPGPLALIGNIWTTGPLLAPEYLIPGSTRILAIDYAWETHKLREWAGHSELRLLITDAENMTSWVADVTETAAGAIIFPADLKISANCRIALQLKAGDRTGKLYTPPYVPRYGVTIRYRY